MTRKDFEVLACAYKTLGYIDPVTGNHYLLVERLATMLETISPRFDREQFLRACEPNT